MEIEISSGKSKDKKYGKYEKYEIEHAADTLMNAEKIKADKEKMKYVAQCMKEKAKNMKKVIASVQDLRDLANEKAMED